MFMLKKIGTLTIKEDTLQGIHKSPKGKLLILFHKKMIISMSVVYYSYVTKKIQEKILE